MARGQALWQGAVRAAPHWASSWVQAASIWSDTGTPSWRAHNPR